MLAAIEEERAHVSLGQTNEGAAGLVTRRGGKRYTGSAEVAITRTWDKRISALVP
jgi:hypothetical protein